MKCLEDHSPLPTNNSRFRLPQPNAQTPMTNVTDINFDLTNNSSEGFNGPED